ncbi:MAG: leucyl/phenylalanyl-tRNA--protein transferase [Metallibacterium scheffleri]
MSSARPYLLAPDDTRFPPVARAHASGLLAIGGDLRPERLRAAYAQGIFPWYSAGEPLLWWSPDPRCVFDTASTHPHRRYARTLRKLDWTLSADRAFAQVLDACAALRPGQTGTWITPAMRRAYVRLHLLGHAHSFEVWDGSELVGGLYGVASGGMFSGESMFSARSGGSKVALYLACRALAAWGMPLLDAQVANAHTQALGAIEIPRAQFSALLQDLAGMPSPADWDAALPLRHAAALVAERR